MGVGAGKMGAGRRSLARAGGAVLLVLAWSLNCSSPAGLAPTGASGNTSSGNVATGVGSGSTGVVSATTSSGAGPASAGGSGGGGVGGASASGSGGGGGSGGESFGATVYGSVEIYTTKDASGVTVRLLNGDVEVAKAITSAAGEYKMDHVPLGTYKFDVARPDCDGCSECNGLIELTSNGQVLKTGPTHLYLLSGFHPDEFVNSGPPVFTASVLDLADFDGVTPLGMTSPAGHNFPIDHIYFNFSGGKKERVVYAPAGGLVLDAMPGFAVIETSKTFAYKIDHVLPDANVVPGSWVKPGQRLGVQDAIAFGVDLYAINSELVNAGFIHPKRYAYSAYHCDKPLKYYEPALAATLYALVDRVGADKDGRIDYDQPGKLIGNWFHESTPADLPGEGLNGVSIVPSPRDPSKIWVNLGNKMSVPGRYAPAVGDPDPATVDKDTGLVVYTLSNQYWSGPPGGFAGYLLAQLLDEMTLKLEFFAGQQAIPKAFTAAAQVFKR